MSFRIICHLITHTGFENELATIFQLCVQFAFETKNNMPF